MSENILLKITKSNFEKLRCAMCLGYLSCAPIRLLPDGSNICGHCSPSDDVLTYRQLTLEAVLSEAEFPCRYKGSGCTTCLSFAHGTNHEDTCRFRLILCTSLNTVDSPIFGDCIWNGPLTKIPEHCMKHHNKIVRNNAEFSLNVEKSRKNIMMVVNADGAFFITYEYDEETFNLSYNVRHFLSNVEEVVTKVLLTNKSDSDYFLQLKGGNCAAFDTFNIDTVNVNINKYLDNLNNPEKIKISLSIIATKSTVDNALETTDLLVNYQTLEALRCSGCQYYLVPPAFYLRPNIICYECSKTAPDCPPCRNQRILNLMQEANYPCRWLECNFVAKGEAIREHEINCKFRVYRCVVSGCSDTFKFASIVNHLKSHECQYFKERFSYTTNLDDSSSSDIRAFAVMKKEIVLILLSTSTLDLSENGHYLSLHTSSFNPLQFRVSVQFGHDHCKCKSKKMSFNNILTVRFSDLPRCFEFDDDLTAVLEIA